MKLLIIGLMAFVGSAQAADFACKGVDRKSNEAAEIDLKDVTSKKLTVVNPEGDEISLDRNLRRNEERLKYAVYSDDTYDGYGGYVKVSIPKEISAKPFTVYYVQAIYSELGKVGEVNVRASCTGK
jgi:hypothetical protein